jgi:hypothetical protein
MIDLGEMLHYIGLYGAIILAGLAVLAVALYFAS